FDFHFCFFFQAEDGIRDRNVTGVQTCALPISARRINKPVQPNLGEMIQHQAPLQRHGSLAAFRGVNSNVINSASARTETFAVRRSEERRVGKECRSRWWGWE